ncbi:hypothetical protein CU097_012904, partial [Rhizopus azygosporus]
MNAGYPVPANLIVQQFNVNTNQYYLDLMPLAAFGDNYNAENKEALREHVSNIDHLQKNRQRKQNSINTSNEKNKITLDYGISYDGHMVSVLFTAENI